MPSERLDVFPQTLRLNYQRLYLVFGLLVLKQNRRLLRSLVLWTHKVPPAAIVG
jgi:hypothetical protein